MMNLQARWLPAASRSNPITRRDSPRVDAAHRRAGSPGAPTTGAVT
jgi:hypothetical protein